MKLGAKIRDPGKTVDFPDSFRINNKSEAIDVLDIILLAQTQDDLSYTIAIDTPLKALKAAIKGKDWG